MAAKRNRLRLNDLPDSLLTLILSKVSLKEAVRCSIISKRWKLLWTFLPNLKFSSADFNFSSPIFSLSSFTRIVDRIFYLHSSPLELLEFTEIPYSYIPVKISEWIHCAALKNVREINITDGDQVEVPKSIFLCHSLRYLALKSFLLTNIPDCFGGFHGLTTLNFYNVELKDKTIELMLQLCPVLEILVLSRCDGLTRLKICSNSIISLNLSESEIEAITANCPRLESFTLIKNYGRNIVQMEFYLPACSSLCTNVAKLEAFTTLKSLRKIAFLNLTSKSDVNILSEFPDLEQMCMVIPSYSTRRFSRSSFSEISATFSLENLKWVHLNMSQFCDPTPLLSYLLRLAPAMKTLLVSRKRGFDGTKALRIVNSLLNLQRQCTETKILLSRNSLNEVRCVNCDEKIIWDTE
ncbi:hypothetical protein SUGI_0346870 [Cryptomeria japonica]|nr:hypothetical protein SUGI_0346870 [Cryptomeria japonica]